MSFIGNKHEFEGLKYLANLEHHTAEVDYSSVTASYLAIMSLDNYGAFKKEYLNLINQVSELEKKNYELKEILEKVQDEKTVEKREVTYLITSGNHQLIRKIKGWFLGWGHESHDSKLNVVAIIEGSDGGVYTALVQDIMFENWSTDEDVNESQ